jgi:hypothetical protein
MPHRPGHSPHRDDLPETKPQGITGTTAPGQSGGFQFKPPSSVMNVGYNEGKVDPGLAAAVIKQQTEGITSQQAKKKAQQAMGSTGVGFGITGFGDFGQGTGGTPPVDTTTVDTDGGVDDTTGDDKDDETKKETKDGKTTYFIKGIGEVSGKMYGAYRRLISQGVPEKDIINAIKGLGAAEEKFAAENLNQKLKVTDFSLIGLLKNALQTPAYENKFLGSAGAANILNKLNSITGKTTEETARLKQEYINKIIKKNPEGFTDLFTLGKGGRGNYDNPTPEDFENTLVGANIGNKNFDKNYYGTRADFYKLNQPQSMGGLADLAGLDAQSINDPFLRKQIFDARAELDRQGRDMFGNPQRQGGSGGGGGGIPTDPTDPTNPNNTYTYPDYNLIRQYRRDEGFTPNYLGGPEQMQLAGGYYDPTAQQFLFGGSGYGGSTNYIGDPQQYFSQGGMVDGKGLSGFKMKGF